MKKRISTLVAELVNYSDRIASPNLQLKAFGLTKIPLIFLVNPKVVLLNSEECKIKIPLSRMTRNHENCMYFGALAIGADLAGGLIAFQSFKKKPLRFLFKDVEGQFLKRCESDAIFHCQDGPAIQEGIELALTSGERINIPLHITVFAPEALGNEPCAKFKLTLSIKSKK